MVRSLWAGATGMIAQQNNVDTIANNIANVNTIGYKTEVNEFKSLLYQNIQTRTTSAHAGVNVANATNPNAGNGNGANRTLVSATPMAAPPNAANGANNANNANNANQYIKPVAAQVGLGVRNASIASQFTQGSMLESENGAALAINGKGMFAVRGEDGETYYTRNGNFNWSLGPNNTLALTNSDGLLVLNTQGNPITVPNNGNYYTNKIEIDKDGQLWYPDAANNMQRIPNMQVGAWQFQNPQGLEKLGDSLFAVTNASGPALNEATQAGLDRSEIRQGYLENSNVQVADEMVNLIIAQRAYEMNSKVIQASDTMMQEANELRR